MSKTDRFRELHTAGCFVIPNPWDAGSARLLEQLGFPALATTSSGFAWSTGRRDNGVTLEDALAHFRVISSAVAIPVNGDFEGGFAVAPEDVGANVAAAAATGIAGVSIEDSTGNPDVPLFEFEPATTSTRGLVASAMAARFMALGILAKSPCRPKFHAGLGPYLLATIVAYSCPSRRRE